MTKANDRQVGGEHYKTTIQHWDYAASNQFDYFQGQITKYVTRWKLKNGIEDLEKAMHFLQKYIEVEKNKKTSCPTEKSIEQYRGRSPKLEQERPFGYDPILEQYAVDLRHPLIGAIEAQSSSREDD